MVARRVGTSSTPVRGVIPTSVRLDRRGTVRLMGPEGIRLISIGRGGGINPLRPIPKGSGFPFATLTVLLVTGVL